MQSHLEISVLKCFSVNNSVNKTVENAPFKFLLTLSDMISSYNLPLIISDIDSTVLKCCNDVIQVSLSLSVIILQWYWISYKL